MGVWIIILVLGFFVVVFFLAWTNTLKKNAKYVSRYVTLSSTEKFNSFRGATYVKLDVEYNSVGGHTQYFCGLIGKRKSSRSRNWSVKMLYKQLSEFDGHVDTDYGYTVKKHMMSDQLKRLINRKVSDSDDEDCNVSLLLSWRNRDYEEESVILKPIK